MEDVLEDGEDYFDDDEADDGPLEAGGVLVVEFAGEDFEEFVDDIEAFVEEFDAFGDV